MRIPRNLSHAALLAVAVLGLGAAQARAQNAVLYELTENMKLRGGDVKRQATAALGGTARVGSSICPTDFAAAFRLDACALHATASDNIDLSTGVGPARGRFAVVIPADGPNDVDGAELVVLEGTLTGTIDLAPAIVVAPGGDRIPLGSIEGRWQAKGTPGGPLAHLTANGTFTGTFRLPFVLPSAPQTPLYLLDPVSGDVRPVAPGEFALGSAMVRLELQFN